MVPATVFVKPHGKFETIRAGNPSSGAFLRALLALTSKSKKIQSNLSNGFIVLRRCVSTGTVWAFKPLIHVAINQRQPKVRVNSRILRVTSLIASDL